MKEVFLLALAWLFLLPPVVEIKAEQYNLSVAGTLSQKVGTGDLSLMKELTIVGKMNASDFAYIREYAKEVLVLDLRGATFPEGVLPSQACYGMEKLKSVVFPFELEAIGDGAFEGTDLEGLLLLPVGLKKIGVGAFGGCKRLNGTLDIPVTVETLGGKAGNGLRGAFYGCAGIEEVVIPAGSKMTRIGDEAFKDCSGLKRLRFPKTVTAIGSGAFAGCKELSGVLDLVAVKIIDGYRSVYPESQGAFEGCEKLEGVNLDPDVLEQIGSRAFKNCSSLQGGVYLHASVQKNSIEVFEGTQMDVHILESSFIRSDNGTGSYPWSTTYSNFAQAVNLQEGHDSRYFFMEGNHEVPETQYIESEHIAFFGGYTGNELWSEQPQGGESRLALSPAAEGSEALVFDHNWDIPLQIDVRNITIDGLTVVKKATGNWEGAKIHNASFYSEAELSGDMTFSGNFVYNTFSSLGRVTLKGVTLNPVASNGYEEALVFTELVVGDDVLQIDCPLFTNGERTILATRGENRPPVNYFHHTVGGRDLLETEEVRFEWQREGELNKLRMITKSPLTISTVKEGVPVLSYGESFRLGVKFSEAVERATEWTSSRRDIVSVDATGYVTAKEVPSDATVTVTAPQVGAEKAISSSCRVYVAGIKMKAVNPRVMAPLGSARFRADVLPENLPDKRLIWSVSDTSLAKIDSVSGIVKAGKRMGYVTVTARLRANERVSTSHEIYIAPVSAVLEPHFASTEPLLQGKSYGFALRVEPSIEQTGIEVSYKVSDNTVVTLHGDSIKALSPGTAVITASIPQGPKDTLRATLTVRVINPVTKIEIEDYLAVGLGDVFTLPVAVYPNDAEVETLTWKSDNPEVVRVGEDGVLEGLKMGRAQVIATTGNGSSDTCEVKVGANKVQISVRSLNLQEGKSYGLSVSFVPVLAQDEVEWFTSDSLVAVVDVKGEVKATGVGKAWITASTGGRRDTCEVNVTLSSSSTSFYLMEKYKEVGEGSVFTLTLINTTGKDVTWLTDHPEIATVSGGVVTPKQEGSAIIKAVSSDGSSRASECVVSVRKSLSTGKVIEEEVQVYYADGALYIKGVEGQEIYIANLAGQRKASLSTSTGQSVYAIALHKGVYLLYTVKGAKQVIHKFTVR